MSEHKLLELDELRDLIKHGIQRHEGCGAVEIGVYRLRGPDQDGNNWAVNFARATDVPKQILAPVLDQVIREAKTRYNLSEN